MQYHINTTPVWDAFKGDCECPLCEIYKKCDARLTSQYLNEAVMEPDYRIQVNKLGFCSTHLQRLYAGENKLGLALQLSTRTDYIVNKTNVIKDIKSAKKESERLKKMDCTCVICDSIGEMMTRYAYTIAQMYKNENEFPALLKKSKGFCIPHYTLLLDNAHKAGSKAAQYLNDLSLVFKSSLEKTNDATKRFTDMFDYRSSEKGLKGYENAVPSAIKKLKGEILVP